MITRTVMATFSAAGFHEWSDAPLGVSYLASQHRHLFHFRVEARVAGDDRDTEFHCLMKAAKLALCRAFTEREHGYMFGKRSCEHIATDLRSCITGNFDISAIEVWEDGECGARIEWSA